MKSIHWPLLRKLRIKLDFAKGTFVLRNVLLQDHEQRFCLLRAQIDPLKVCYLHLFWRLCAQGTKGEKEVPYAYAYLHTVGVTLAVVVGGGEFYAGRLRGHGHESSRMK